jgi:plant cysteine oxidase
MPSATVPAIQKLYDVCRVSFSEKGPLFAEAVDNVQAVLGMNFYPLLLT